MKTGTRLPSWLKRRMPASESFSHTHHVISSLGIDTICNSANCPNKGKCWDRGTATVLILGDICTRNCRFCSVSGGEPKPPDASEPGRVAKMAKEMKLKYLVITSVSRDDLQDGGAEQFAETINTCRQKNPDLEFELLVPDFKGCSDQALDILSTAMPFVFGHNVETVPSLYSTVRPGAEYQRSLGLLKKAKEKLENVETKSSIMLGLGEKDDEVIEVLKDLRDVGCDRLAIGQYLRPTKNSLEVVEYIEPEKFEQWKDKATELGFAWVKSSPFTRSSYHAEEKL